MKKAKKAKCSCGPTIQADVACEVHHPAARPPVKWAGGKTQLLPHLLARLPARIETYFEPFLGGGALFFALASEHPRRFRHACLSDANEELVMTYVAIRDDLDAILACLEGHSKRHSEKHYYAVREAGVLQGHPPATAARFIYLNKAGFNGLYRVNRKGEFNVPWGKHASYAVDVENLTACSRALQDVDLFVHDVTAANAVVRKLARKPGAGDFLYADPPYVPVSKTADFTSYTKDGFSWQDQKKLVDIARHLATKGVRVLLSNADTTRVRRLYRGGDFTIERVEARRNINSKGDARGKVGEVLISTRFVKGMAQ